jgi:hypothetical protein
MSLWPWKGKMSPAILYTNQNIVCWRFLEEHGKILRVHISNQNKFELKFRMIVGFIYPIMHTMNVQVNLPVCQSIGQGRLLYMDACAFVLCMFCYCLEWSCCPKTFHAFLICFPNWHDISFSSYILHICIKWNVWSLYSRWLAYCSKQWAI